MKAIVEALRGARHLEVLLALVLIAALGLLMFQGSRTSADKTDVESRLERLLEGIEGVGDVDVMISMDDKETPVGAAVVASGKLGMRARLEIQSAIQALLDIETNRIRVIGRGDDG